MPDIVSAERLVKRYGPRLAVRDVSFAIGEGEIIGLLGPNGSGKSTILRMLAGYLQTTSGTLRVAGIDVAANSLAVRRQVGYVPEDAPLYDGMRVAEFLRFMSAIKGLRGGAVRAAVDMAVGLLDLGPVAATPIGKLSRGYRQRVAIAQALLGDPPVLVLDEPTNALDAYQVIGVRELVRSMAGRRTVLLASHVLAEIDRLASRVMILRDGRLLSADALREAGPRRRLRLRVGGPSEAVLAVLRRASGVVAAAPAGDDADAYLVETAAGAPPAALAEAIVSQGFALEELTEVKPDLEQIFLELTRHASAVEGVAA
ncbi:MAG TPA: ABC transporter ATP-binding protein [Stellaceae bacterium]